MAPPTFIQHLTSCNSSMQISTSPHTENPQPYLYVTCCINELSLLGNKAPSERGGLQQEPVIIFTTLARVAVSLLGVHGAAFS